MKERGFNSQNELAKAAFLTPQQLNAIVAFRVPVTNRKGDWSFAVENLAAVLKCYPEDLFSEAQRDMVLRKNSVELDMDEAQVASLASGEDLARHVGAKVAIEAVLKTLTDIEQTVLKRRMEGDVYEAVGDDLKLSRERVRQIELRALRRLRHPSRASLLADYALPS
jgi:DNA-directed RNA polymerase sigma subunit (sigma70/sigma32)